MRENGCSGATSQLAMKDATRKVRGPDKLQRLGAEVVIRCCGQMGRGYGDDASLAM